MNTGKRRAGRLHAWLLQKRWRRPVLIAACAVLLPILLLGLAGWFLLFCPWGLYHANNPYSLSGGLTAPPTPLQLQYNGVTYEIDDDVVNILLLGVDDEVDETDPGWQASVGKGYPADTLVLCSYNTRTNKAVLLPLSRHFVALQGIPSINGKSIAWQQHDHLNLAHTYGESPEQSGQLTKASVSWLLGGIPIHRYISVKIGAVRHVTNYVGGVQVFTLPDFAEVAGTQEGDGLLLDGEMAELFVRGRSLTGMTGRDLDRMVRQRVFLFSLLDTVKKQVKENPLFALGLYQEMAPYISTDLSLREMGNLARGLLLQGGEVALEVMSGDEVDQVYTPDEGWIEWFVSSYCMRPVE